MLAAYVAIGVTVGAVAAIARQQAAPPPSGRDVPAIADFLDRVTAYAALHRRLENTAPKLPDEATPAQIDARQRALAALIQAARTEAKRGDLFTPEMTAFARNLLNRVFAGAEGKQLLSSIMDENPVDIPLKANQRYPDDVPFATMPPEVLRALPDLPEEMEYRFIGDDLILLDPHAHLIVDFIADALPGR
jgi:hypothetical protein